MTLTKKITLGLLLIVFAVFAFNVLAQTAPPPGRELEIKYPEIEGERPERTITPVPEYVKYIFNTLIWLSGIIALVVLIIAGFQYFTSAGSPERIKDAKDKIGAALLGLLILFGSYLILTSINPELVVFHLKRLRPIISTLPQGVLVCKEEIVEVERAFQLTIDFPYIQEYEQQKRAKEELDKILDKIALKCYSVPGSGDIIPSFDNKITDIYFIPGMEKGYAVAYGTIIYEETGYKGRSQALYEQINWVGSPRHYGKNDFSVKISSIKSFTTQWQPDPNWKVTLYQEANFNAGWAGAGLGGPGEKSYSSPGQSLYQDFPNLVNDLGNSPKSIKIEGDLLAILFTTDERSDSFFNGSDHNLEDNLSIVDWVDCKQYQSQTTQLQQIYVGGTFGGGFQTIQQCAKAATTRMIIISAKLY